MSLFSIVKDKMAELKERKEFLDMVEKKAKPLRRAAYMKQMLKEVVNEGVAKAQLDAENRLPKKKKVEADFGMKKDTEDPWKFLDQIGKPEKPKPKTPTKLKGKKK